MRAVVLTSPNARLDVRDDHPEPDVGSGTTIDVTACGVCHSDLHVVDGDFPSPMPIVLGHEVTGLHAELGPVVLYAPWGCRNCQQCAEGLEMICADSTEAGLFTDGGYAERMRVPNESYLAPLGELDPYDAAPLACGGLTAYRAVLHALDRLRDVGPAGRALIIGAGGLGQFALRYLRLLTDSRVVAVDLSPAKRDTALALGAHEAVAPSEIDGAFDAVIDFVGAEPTLTAGAAAVTKQGLLIVVGLAGGRIPFGFGAVPHEARLLASVWGSRAQLDDLLELAHREPTIVQPVEVVPLAEAQTAHDRLRAGDLGGRLVLDIAGDRAP